MQYTVISVPAWSRYPSPSYLSPVPAPFSPIPPSLHSLSTYFLLSKLTAFDEEK